MIAAQEWGVPAGSRTSSVALQSLADLLADVSREYPALGRRVCDETGAIRRFVNVYIGDDESRSLQGLQTPVPGDATVFIVGSVAGG